MSLKTIYKFLIGLALVLCANGTAFGQYMPTQTTTIPLAYIPFQGSEYRLGINVGINGGPLQSYLFDTGSQGFNAAYNPTTWNGFGGGSTTSVPASTIPNGNNIEFCYGTSNNGCRGFAGNIVQVPSLTFQNTTGGTTTLNTPAGGGFQITALSSDSNNLYPGSPIWSYPDFFCGAPFSCPNNPNAAPPDLPSFYGIFGAGNFATLLSGCSVVITVTSTCPTGNVTAPAVVGSPLGQITVANSNIAQGYMVAANG